MDLQDVFDRIEVAADVADNVRRRFISAETYLIPAEDVSADINRIKTFSQQVSLLQLKTRVIIKVCSVELSINIKRQAPSVNPNELPDNGSGAADLVERFAGDAEEAFDDLIARLQSRIAEDSRLFASCMSDLLEHLDPTDADYWKLVGSTVRHNPGYGFSFVDSRIEKPVAVLKFLGHIRDDVPDMVEQLKINQWIAATVARLYETAAAVHAGPQGDYPGSLYNNNAVLVGQSVARIWQFDPDYKDTRSWFPPSHPWWPFHLPGEPVVLREHILPAGRVANMVFLPWGDETIAVGMADGKLLLFDNKHETPARQFRTGLYPTVTEYSQYGLMVHGRRVFDREGPMQQWLLLSDSGRSLENETITERTPTEAELQELESLSWMKRKRRLKELTTSTIVIEEGLVPYPATHPGFFTLAQAGQRYIEQDPNRRPFVESRRDEDTTLRPVAFYQSGYLKGASEHSNFHVGLDAAKSRLVMESRRLQSQHSFLVAPGVDHFDIGRNDRLLALAGNGHLYLYCARA